MKKVLIVGSGWAGTSASYLLENSGISTTIFEKNNVVGGHSRSEILNNIIYEPNGPHIFHTSIERVNKFVVKFGMNRKFKHQIKSRIYPDSLNGESLLVSWPPQVSELKKLKEWKKIESELENLPKNPKVENFETYAISIMGQTLYDLFIYGYTKKQWDLEPTNLSSNFAPKRIDLRYDNNKAIFKDKWEYFHPEGSGKVIENILKNKEVILNQKININNLNEIENFDCVIITAPLDEFLYEEIKLDWRGIESRPIFYENIENNQYVTEAYQINHPSLNEKFTRTVETKHASGQSVVGSIVVEEYSKPNIRHYPVFRIEKNNTEINENLKNEIIKESKFPTYFCGRLANYTYINQDQAIEQGFQCAEEIIKFLS